LWYVVQPGAKTSSEASEPFTRKAISPCAVAYMRAGPGWSTSNCFSKRTTGVWTFAPIMRACQSAGSMSPISNHAASLQSARPADVSLLIRHHRLSRDESAGPS
jgi:hypothetical protein